MPAVGVAGVLFWLAYLGIFIYLMSLAVRFVKAVERIADKFDQK